MTDAARLVELIRERQPCVVLTGAGVSTESGIPDFRSPQGLWAQFDPFEYGSIDAFRADFFYRLCSTLMTVTGLSFSQGPQGRHRVGRLRARRVVWVDVPPADLPLPVDDEARRHGQRPRVVAVVLR